MASTALARIPAAEVITIQPSGNGRSARFYRVKYPEGFVSHPFPGSGGKTIYSIPTVVPPKRGMSAPNGEINIIIPAK